MSNLNHDKILLCCFSFAIWGAFFPSAFGQIPLKLGGLHSSYRFSGPEKIVENLVPDGKPLRYMASEANETPEILGKNHFETEPFFPNDKGFTVELCFKKLGLADNHGQGADSGTLFGMGDGYWSGMRLVTSYPDRRVHFMIGRPQPSSAITISSVEPVIDGVWNHVAVSWNGEEMRIYLNGNLSGVGKYAGPFTKANWNLRLGFNDAGVGAVRFEPKTFAVYQRALEPDEIFMLATNTESLSDKLRNEIKTVTDIQKRILEKSNIDSNLLYELIIDFYSDIKKNEIVNPEMQIALAIMKARLIIEPEIRKAAFRDLLEWIDEKPQSPEIQNIRLRLLREVLFPESIDLETPVVRGTKTQYEELLQQGGLTDKEITYIKKCMEHAALFEAGFKTKTLLPEISMPNSIQKIKPRSVHSPNYRPTVRYHVSPMFKDTAAESNQFATLEQARDAIRELKKNDGLPPGGVEVTLEGRFNIRDTIVFEEEDSGTAESPIMYRGINSNAMFSGGINLGHRSRFGKVTDAKILERIPEQARDKVLYADLSALNTRGVNGFFPIKQRGYGFNSPDAAPWFSVYVQQRTGKFPGKTIPYTLAQYPDTMDNGLSRYMTMGKVLQGQIGSPTENRPGIFEYTDERVERWTNAEEAWLFGYWGHLWACNSLPLEKIDTGKKLIHSKTHNNYGFRESYPFYVFNLIEELDQPGEWFLDRKNKILYVIPHDDISEREFNTMDIFVPVFAGPFIQCRDLSHVTFRGLRMSDCAGTAFKATGGRNLVLADCEINRLGAWGVAMHDGMENGVLGCKMRYLGGGGVAMSGGDAKTLTPGKCFVENCTVEHFTLVDRGYAPAVSLDGVGNHIVHNRFAYSTHHAIRMGGFEHLVEYNEIDNVVLEADDQAGLDMWGDPIGRGNVIRYNFWSNIYNHAKNQSIAGFAGIRLDDMISGVHIYGNVFYNCGDGHFGAVQIHGGKDNRVENNLMINCLAALSFSTWGEKRWKENLIPSSHFWKRSTLDAGTDPLKPPHVTKYPEYNHLGENADRNFVTRNLAFVEKDFAFYQRGQNEMSDNFVTDMPYFPKTPELSPENRKLISNPRFYTRFGLRPIPVEQIGPY